MKQQVKGGVRQPEKLFGLAEAVNVFFGNPWGEAAIQRFREDAAWYRERFRKRNQQDWMVYVIRLILTCPVLLERPKGLEWVVKDLRQILENRHFSKDVDSDFWMS